jgi:uncharacterized protein YjdB
VAGRHILIAGLICSLALGETACSNPSQPRTPDPSTDIVSVQGVGVSPKVIHFLVIGESRQLSARVVPVNATDQAVAWESTDTTVATVDVYGRVTAKGAGSGIFITAYTHDGRHQASANVSVNP